MQLMISRFRLGQKLLSVAVLFLLPQLACAGSLKVGSISTSPVVETRKFWPLASYLERHLQSEGVDTAKVVVAENIPMMSSFLLTQQVDIYIDSLFPAVAVSHLSGSKLMLRRWKFGKGEYQSIIFTRKDSGITRLEDLKGNVIAFESPFASSSYFFPKLALLEKGLRLTLKRQGIDPVKSEEVGYIFSGSDSQTILLVLNGMVAAGATDDQKYFTMTKNLDRFKVLHETAAFSRQIVSYRADLPAALVTRVREVLLTMHQTAAGRQALQDFESTTKFEEIPTRDLDLMTTLKKHVDAELKGR
jgi:ABC-type phosphate/phosphonate transport system substrate-binding protein